MVVLDHEAQATCILMLKDLFLQGRQDITHLLDNRHFRFDPREGLIVTNGDIRFHTSDITCEATLGDLKETFKAKLIFQPLPRFIRTPKMKFPKRKELKLGSDIEIVCDHSWESGSRHIDLKWDFPHASNARLGNITQVNIPIFSGWLLLTLRYR